MRGNVVKERVAAGQPAIGIMCSVASPLQVEMLGHAGYDFAVVDLQHGETNLDSVQAMLQALSSTPAVPIVRTAANVAMYIQRALDLGAYGIIVPQVNTRAEAEAIVASVRYAPRGNRSWGPIRGAIYGGADYFTAAADTLLTLPMLESAEAVRNAEEILGVDGVDGCFVGPADLNISLGHSPDDPALAADTEAAVAHIAAVAQRLGKLAGMHAVSLDDARRRIAQGYRFVTVMTDLRLLRAAAVPMLAALKGG